MKNGLFGHTVTNNIRDIYQENSERCASNNMRKETYTVYEAF